jgi:glycosyltransferase involved in cell wall biosynthesis
MTAQPDVAGGGANEAVILSPNPANRAGGVERMCALLKGVLEQDGWRVNIVGPGRTPSRWVSRVGAGYLAGSISATRGAMALRPRLLITNGFLGCGRPRHATRIHVYHGTMVGNTRAEGNSLPRHDRIRRTIGAGLAEAAAGRGAAVVSVSQKAAEEVRRYYGVKSDAVIPNGVDTKMFRPQPREQARQSLGLASDGRYALYVGRLQRLKGTELLVDASREAGYELLIAGESGDSAATRNLGVLDPQELARAYAAADCVLFPSRYEACSYVVLEALSCGVPLITTRVGWMPSFLQGVPQYERLCVEPVHDEIVARLRALPTIDTASLTSAAREWIVTHNSLESYASHWRALLADLNLSAFAAG